MSDYISKLVLRTQQGDLSAFGELYDQYANLVRMLCLDGTGDADRAADLAQEVFMRAYRSIQKIREPEKFKSWLAGLTRNVVREWAKKPRLRQIEQPETTATVCLEADHDDYEQLHAALQRLPQRERWALHLFYFSDGSIRDVCEGLQLSVAGSYRLLSRARQNLKHEILKEESQV